MPTILFDIKAGIPENLVEAMCIHVGMPLTKEIPNPEYDPEVMSDDMENSETVQTDWTKQEKIDYLKADLDNLLANWIGPVVHTLAGEKEAMEELAHSGQLAKQAHKDKMNILKSMITTTTTEV